MPHSRTRRPQLAPRPLFLRRFGWSAAAGGVLIVFSLGIGMVGYHSLAGLSWIDSFLDASMILSGMGPVAQLSGTAAKIFAGCYALYSGIALISTAGVILAPVIHRALHKFHLEDTASDKAEEARS